MNDAIQETIWEGSFKVCGRVMRCSILADGTRIINAEDMLNFFQAGVMPDPASEGDRLFLEWVGGA